MPHFFVAMRIWSCFSPDFPFERFDDIPDDELPQALEAFALTEFQCRLPEIESRHQERIVQLKRQSAQRLGSESRYLRPRRRSQPWWVRRPSLEPGDDDFGRLPVYLRAFAYLGVWNPPGRLPAISPSYLILGEYADRDLAKLAAETVQTSLKNIDRDGAFYRFTPRASVTCVGNGGAELATARIRVARDRSDKGAPEYSWYVMRWLPEIDAIFEHVTKAWPSDQAGQHNAMLPPSRSVPIASWLPAADRDENLDNERALQLLKSTDNPDSKTSAIPSCRNDLGSSPVTTKTGKKAKQSRLTAASQYQAIVSEFGEMKYAQAYEILENRGEESLPALATWKAYVSEGLAAQGTPKNTPRMGAPTGSVRSCRDV